MFMNELRKDISNFFILLQIDSTFVDKLSFNCLGGHIGWTTQTSTNVSCIFLFIGDAGCGGSVLSLPQVVELPDSDGFIDDVSCGASHTVVKLSEFYVLLIYYVERQFRHFFLFC